MVTMVLVVEEFERLQAQALAVQRDTAGTWGVPGTGKSSLIRGGCKCFAFLFSWPV